MVTENTANFGGGHYLDKRWVDLIDLANIEKTDQRDGKEIAKERLDRFGITVTE